MRAGPYRVIEDSFRVQRTRFKSCVSVASLSRTLTVGMEAKSGFGFYYCNQKHPSLKIPERNQTPRKVWSSITFSEEDSYFTYSLFNQCILAYVTQLWHVLHFISLQLFRGLYKWNSVNNKYIASHHFHMLQRHYCSGICNLKYWCIFPGCRSSQQSFSLVFSTAAKSILNFK